MKKITIVLEVNGKNSGSNFYNMKQFSVRLHFWNYYISNENIFDIYSSVDNFELNASTTEIKVKLCMYIGLFTHTSFLYERSAFYLFEVIRSTKVLIMEGREWASNRLLPTHCLKWWVTEKEPKCTHCYTSRWNANKAVC